MIGVSYQQRLSLSGRTAVVTGGVGIIGKALCQGLAEMGAQVAVVDLDPVAAEGLASELSDAYGHRAIGLACDVSDPGQVEAMAAGVEERLGCIDILHNNAATKTSDLAAFFAPVESYTPETWREVMSVNLDGLFSVASVIGGGMAARGRGSIVQTASIYGAMAPDNRIYDGSFYMGRQINSPPSYAASKAGVIGLTRYLATYWALQGVRVNAICPGGVFSGQNEEFERRYSGRVPMGRMARVEEIVGAMLFLASDASSYMTGQILMVDGGLSAW